jgi:uncharacterized Zn finger protein (UPF0148 family)
MTMTRCQHCLKWSQGIQKDGHHFCPHCGKAKRGPSNAVLEDVNKYKHQHWTAPLDNELAGAGAFCGDSADQLV